MQKKFSYNPVLLPFRNGFEKRSQNIVKYISLTSTLVFSSFLSNLFTSKNQLHSDNVMRHLSGKKDVCKGCVKKNFVRDVLI